MPHSILLLAGLCETQNVCFHPERLVDVPAAERFPIVPRAHAAPMRIPVAALAGHARGMLVMAAIGDPDDLPACRSLGSVE